MADPNVSNGILFIATGADYLRIAERGAKTAKAMMPNLPVDLITDGLHPVEEGVFDDVRIGSGETGPRARLRWLKETRFDRTLHVDADVTFVDDLQDVFRLLDKYELAVAQDQSRNAIGNCQPLEHNLPDSFPQFNCGVIAYRSTPPVMLFFEDWNRMYHEREDPRDQPTFRLLVWQSDLRVGVLPPEYNLMNLALLNAWSAEHASPRLLHTPRLHRKIKQGEGLYGDIDDLLGERFANRVRLLIEKRYINLERRPRFMRKFIRERRQRRLQAKHMSTAQE
ncbi:MAG: putative nucleotide-diphospho-sugar transferase [Pseudomonadota bacterium]